MKEPTNSRGFAKESRKRGKGISGQNEGNVSERILFNSVDSVLLGELCALCGET